MAVKVADLMVHIGADAKALDKALDHADSKLSRFGKAAGAFGAVIAAGAATSAVALYRVGQTFDQVQDTIRVGTGATGQALDGLMDSARNIGKTVPADFGQIGTAVADLNTRLGLTGKPLEDMAGQFLNLSRITGTDVSSNIAGLTRLFGDWGVAVEDQPAKLDAIYRASQATGAGIDELAASATKFGGPMRQLGFSFDETLALLGKFEKEGVNADLVMGSMRIALGKMAKAGEAPAETLSRVTDQIKNAGTAGEANALALEMFGAKAGPDMAAAIREGRFEIADLIGTIANGTDTINGAAGDTASFAEQWQLFKNNVLLVLEPIAARVFGALGRGMEFVNSQGPRFEHLAAVVAERFGPALEAAGDAAAVAFTYLRDEALPVVMDLAREVFAFGERIVPVLVGAFTAVVSAGVQVIAFLNRHREAVGVTAGILTGVLIPVLLLLGVHWVALQVKAAVSAARQAAAWLVTQVSAIKAAAVHGAQVVAMVARWAFLGLQAMLHAGKVVAGWVLTGAAALRAAAVHAAHVVAMVAKWVFLGAQSLLHAGRVAAAWFVAMGPVGWVIATVIALVALIIANWDKIKQVTGAAWDWVSRKLSDVWGGIKRTAGDAAGWVLTTVLTKFEELKRRAGELFENLRAGLSDTWGRIREAFAAPVRFVVNSVYNDGIRRFYNAVADKIPGLPSLPHIGLPFAEGGPVRNGRGLQLGPNRATGDTVPAWLRPDEFVVRGDGSNLAEAIDHFGIPLALGGLVGDAWDKLKGAGSAVVGAMGNAAGWVRDLASKAGGAVAEAALGPLRGLIDRTLGGLGGPGGMAGGLAKTLIDKAIGLVKSRDVMESGLGLAGQPLGVRRMMELLNAAFGNVRLISGFRPGAITATGNPSYHGRGRAVDIPPVMAYFDWIARNFPNSRELIFSPAGGRQIHNGRRRTYSGITRAMHWDHVHWAYDQGGLARGAGLLPKLTSAPERVLSPEQTRAFERLVEVLDRRSLSAVQAGPVPVEKHLHYHAAVGRSLPEDDFVDAAGRARMLGW